jgi:hypothetical protein
MRLSILPGQFLVGQAATDYMPHNVYEPLNVSHIQVVIAKRLFVIVAEEMKGSTAT